LSGGAPSILFLSQRRGKYQEENECERWKSSIS
jgi:hypothetical protein